MFRFFKHRLPDRVFKNSRSTETPAGPGRPSRAWVRTDYNLASVSSKGRKSGVRPVLGKRRTDWTLGNTAGDNQEPCTGLDDEGRPAPICRNLKIAVFTQDDGPGNMRQQHALIKPRPIPPNWKFYMPAFPSTCKSSFLYEPSRIIRGWIVCDRRYQTCEQLISR